jgi:1,2-diacylglycerol 3-alpha-glucosyltransferase
MTGSPPTLALLHHQFGPYHVARARVLRRAFPGTVQLIQLAESEAIRDWRADPGDLAIETAVSGMLEAVPDDTIAANVERILERLRPDVIAISGYAHPAMRRAAAWARRRGAKAILISDSQARDLPRRRWKELLKRAFVSRHFDGAFVSGASAAFYVESLGIPAHRIWRGYDVVDNAHFAEGARRARADAGGVRASLGLPPRYFLYVGRFAPEKNLAHLIGAFARACREPRFENWSLVLVGGGPLEADLRRQAAPLGARVRFVAFQQKDQLPAYYGLAEALVLPSLVEPWGLVVNEAMAAGLPVVISRQCGCAMELVFPGINGVIVDEKDVPGLAAALVALAGADARRQAYGKQSSRLVATFSLETWAEALTSCGLEVTS